MKNGLRDGPRCGGFIALGGQNLKKRADYISTCICSLNINDFNLTTKVRMRDRLITNWRLEDGLIRFTFQEHQSNIFFFGLLNESTNGES